MEKKDIFCIRLEKTRKEQEKTTAEVARYLGVTPGTYRRYETGKSEPSIQKLIAIANYFDVTLNYLMGRTDS